MSTYKLTDSVSSVVGESFLQAVRQRQTNYEMVQEFHEVMGTRRNVWPPTQDLLSLRCDLIAEEINEVAGELPNDQTDLEALKEISKQRLAKELADLLYVVYGTADAFGIDIDRVFAEVHRSNMSKLVDGKPLKREDGKVLKGPNYTPPDLSFVV